LHRCVTDPPAVVVTFTSLRYTDAGAIGSDVHRDSGLGCSKVIPPVINDVVPEQVEVSRKALRVLAAEEVESLVETVSPENSAMYRRNDIGILVQADVELRPSFGGSLRKVVEVMERQPGILNLRLAQILQLDYSLYHLLG
jgi:hypothetical protein